MPLPDLQYFSRYFCIPVFLYICIPVYLYFSIFVYLCVGIFCLISAICHRYCLVVKYFREDKHRGRATAIFLKIYLYSCISVYLYSCISVFFSDKIRRGGVPLPDLQYFSRYICIPVFLYIFVYLYVSTFMYLCIISVFCQRYCFLVKFF